MDSPNHTEGMNWNLMDSQTDDEKRDLTFSQASAIEETPDKPDEPIGG